MRNGEFFDITLRDPNYRYILKFSIQVFVQFLKTGEMPEENTSETEHTSLSTF